MINDISNQWSIWHLHIKYICCIELHTNSCLQRYFNANKNQCYQSYNTTFSHYFSSQYVKLRCFKIKMFKSAYLIVTRTINWLSVSQHGHLYFTAIIVLSKTISRNWKINNYTVKHCYLKIEKNVVYMDNWKCEYGLFIVIVSK